MRRLRWKIGICLIILLLSAGNAVSNPQPVNAAQPFFRGVDISTLQAVEDGKGAYFENGVQRDLFVILKRQGINYVRLRIWNNPAVDAQGYSDLPHTVQLAKRAKQAGMRILLDFHYSDFWADPGKQNKPKAWVNLTHTQLVQAVRAYTKQVISTLRKNGAMPDAVQIGNEISGGMLWPNGKTYGAGSGGFDGLVQLLQAGIQGVRDAEPKKGSTKIMLHLDTGGNNAASRWFFDAIVSRKVAFDYIGLSYYPYWHGKLSDLASNMADLSARYKKPVIVAETAIGFTTDFAGHTSNIFGDIEAVKTGYAPTESGQAAFLRNLIRTVQRVPNGQGLGVFYWEPGWIQTEFGNSYATPDNAWKNQALFDYNGNMLLGLSVLGHYVPPKGK